MSGAPGVPLMVAAVFVGQVAVQVLLVLTGFFSFLLAAYLIWRVERQRVLDLERQLAPAVALAFDGNAEPRVVLNAPRRLGYLVGIENIGGRPITVCKVFLRIVDLARATALPIEGWVTPPFALLNGETTNVEIVLAPLDESPAPVHIYHYHQHPDGRWYPSPQPRRLPPATYELYSHRTFGPSAAPTA